jgi:hypothetical protein
MPGEGGEAMNWQEEYCKEYARTRGRIVTIEVGASGFHYLMDKDGQVIMCREPSEFKRMIGPMKKRPDKK